jgi:hypothetical protein
MIVRPFREELRLLVMPVFQGVDGRSALQHGLRELAVVEPDVAQDGLLEVLAGAESVALQNVLDPAVEPLDHAVCLRPHGRREAVLDAEFGAEAGITFDLPTPDAQAVGRAARLRRNRPAGAFCAFRQSPGLFDLLRRPA